MRDLLIIIIVFLSIIIFAIIKINSSNKVEKVQNETILVDDTEEQLGTNENEKIKLTQNQLKNH